MIRVNEFTHILQKLNTKCSLFIRVCPLLIVS